MVNSTYHPCCQCVGRHSHDCRRQEPVHTGIVRALIANFIDHSAPEGCRCGERDEEISHSTAVTQAGAGGEAAPATKPQE